jgi:hypothetical protein
MQRTPAAGTQRGVFALWLIALASLYVLTLRTSIYWNDAPEFVDVAYTLGIAHPPGSPTYALLAKLATLVPLGGITARVHLFSAACAVGALALCALCVRRLHRGMAGRHPREVEDPGTLSPWRPRSGPTPRTRRCTLPSSSSRRRSSTSPCAGTNRATSGYFSRAPSSSVSLAACTAPRSSSSPRSHSSWSRGSRGASSCRSSSGSAPSGRWARRCTSIFLFGRSLNPPSIGDTPIPGRASWPTSRIARTPSITSARPRPGGPTSRSSRGTSGGSCRSPAARRAWRDWGCCSSGGRVWALSR